MPQPSSARLHEFTVVSNDRIAEGVWSLVIEAPRLPQPSVPASS